MMIACVFPVPDWLWIRTCSSELDNNCSKSLDGFGYFLETNAEICGSCKNVTQLCNHEMLKNKATIYEHTKSFRMSHPNKDASHRWLPLDGQKSHGMH